MEGRDPEGSLVKKAGSEEPVYSWVKDRVSISRSQGLVSRAHPLPPRSLMNREGCRRTLTPDYGPARHPGAQLPISPSSENCSLLMEAAAAIRKSQAERGQSTGLTQRGCRAPAKAAALRASPGPGCLPTPSGFPGLLPSGRAALHRRQWLCPPGARDQGRGEG